MRVTLIFFVLVNSALGQLSDSLHKIRWYHVTACLGYNIGIGKATDNGHSMVMDESGRYYEFDRKPYDFKSPSIGLGFLANFEEVFFKADLSYVYSTRHYSRTYGSSSATDKGTVYDSYFPSSASNWVATHNVGDTYYRCTDNVNVDLIANYSDLNMLFGKKIDKNFAFTLGFRSCNLISYFYKGKIDRTASQYMITSINTPTTNPVFKDSLIETHTLAFEERSELRSKITQRIEGAFYWNLGFNYMCNFKKGGLMFDLIYDRMKGRNSYVLRDYYTLKLTYFY